MKKKTKAAGKQAFSEALQQAIMSDFSYVEVDLPKLDKKDVEDPSSDPVR